MKKHLLSMHSKCLNFIASVEAFLETHRHLLLISLSLIGGLFVRFCFRGFLSNDMQNYLLPWTEEIVENGGIQSIGYPIGNYTPAYMLLLSLITYIPLNTVLIIKGVSIAFDILLAAGCYQVVHHLTSNKLRSSFAFCFAFLLPTVIFNSALWGQCDSIYAAFLVWAIYFVLCNRGLLAGIFLGAALAFKLQAVFLLPVVLLLVTASKLKIRHLLVCAATYIAIFMPSFIAGRPLSALWSVYDDQVNIRVYLVAKVPNLMVWFGESPTEHIYLGLIALSLCGLMVLYFWLWCNRKYFNDQTIIAICALTVVLILFTMPRMHERYMYVGTIFTILLAVVKPKLWYIALACAALDYFDYSIYLFDNTAIEMAYLVPVFFVPLVGLIRYLHQQFNSIKKQGQSTISVR